MEALALGAAPPPDVQKGAARGFPRAALENRLCFGYPMK